VPLYRCIPHLHFPFPSTFTKTRAAEFMQ
jgi:hypothetical protein